MLSEKDLFLSYPTINPQTGESIDIHSKEFKTLTNIYGIPKIKSPKSKRQISIGGNAYKKLLAEGYTDDVLLGTTKKLDTHHYLPSDPYIHIFNIDDRLNINDLISLYRTNKFYQRLLNTKNILDHLSHQYQLDNSTSFKAFIKKYKDYCMKLLILVSYFYQYKKSPLPQSLKLIALELNLYDEFNDNVSDNILTLTYTIMPYKNIIVKRPVFITKLTNPETGKGVNTNGTALKKYINSAKNLRIQVINPFNENMMSMFNNIPLTVMDVVNLTIYLYTGRMNLDYRDAYHIVSDDGDSLVLEANMINDYASISFL